MVAKTCYMGKRRIGVVAETEEQWDAWVNANLKPIRRGAMITLCKFADYYCYLKTDDPNKIDGEFDDVIDIRPKPARCSSGILIKLYQRKKL